MPRPCSAAPSSWWGSCSIAARSRAARSTGSSWAWACWPAVAQPAPRRERGDLRRQRLRRRAPLAPGHHAIRQTDPLGFARIYGTSGQYQVERAAEPDQPRQSYGPAVPQRHAPAPAEDAEHGVLLQHAQIAPEGELEPTGARVAGDGGDRGLAQEHARGAHRSVAGGLGAVSAAP